MWNFYDNKYILGAHYVLGITLGTCFPFHHSRLLNSVGENHVITLTMSNLCAAQQTPTNSSVSVLPHICNSSHLLLYLSLEIHSRLFPLMS